MKKITLFVSLLFCHLAIKAQQNTLNLLPVPKSVVVANAKFRLTNKFSVFVNGLKDDTILYKAVNRAYQALNRKTGLAFGFKYISPTDTLTVAQMQVAEQFKAKPTIGLDENYNLKVNENGIVLSATNTIGVLHGLQTLVQLVAVDDKGYYLPVVAIDDSPRFKWRGLMIDVARHFVSVEEIKHNIDAMAAVKLNVLHWHLTDDEGFRVESKIYPLLQEKGSNGDYYTQVQIKEIVAYAGDRGIIVVPEFDMPGHAQSWFAGYPELASLPGPYHPGPRGQWQQEHPDPNAPKGGSIADIIANMVAPTFDPTNEKLYLFLDKFIGEMTSLFPSGYVHIGADENNGMAWKKSPAIVAWMKDHQIANTDELQRYYVERVYKILKKHHRQLIGWEEIFNDKLSKDAIVHKWIPEGNGMVKSYGKIPDFTVHGNPVLLSVGFYTDVFMPAYIHYQNPFLQGLDDAGVLGGEAAQWTELADNENIDGRIWPRTAAIAERLWSPGNVNDVDDMYRRLFVFNRQLDEQGFPHLANYERALRRLSNGGPIENIKTLTDVLSPVKGYKKLIGNMMRAPQASYQTTPLTAVSDIIPVDSEVKRKFRALVKLYLEKHDKDAENGIRNYLIDWQKNDALIEPLFAGNKRLSEIQDHSKNLSAAAAIGLDALDKADKGITDAAAVQQRSAQLDSYAKPHYETEIAVIPEIAELVIGHVVAEPESYPSF